MHSLISPCERRLSLDKERSVVELREQREIRVRRIIAMGESISRSVLFKEGGLDSIECNESMLDVG